MNGNCMKKISNEEKIYYGSFSIPGHQNTINDFLILTN